MLQCYHVLPSFSIFIGQFEVYPVFRQTRISDNWEKPFSWGVDNTWHDRNTWKHRETLHILSQEWFCWENLHRFYHEISGLSGEDFSAPYVWLEVCTGVGTAFIAVSIVRRYFRDLDTMKLERKRRRSSVVAVFPFKRYLNWRYCSLWNHMEQGVYCIFFALA